MRIPRELEYLERLVKLTRKKKDENTGRNQVAIVNNTFAVKRISMNKTYQGKTMAHLPMEINNGLIEGFVDIGASMLVMVASIV